MPSVNMHEAKTNLSKLVEALVSGSEQEITISRNGKPAVRMTAVASERPKRRLGLAKGKFTFDHDESDRLDAEVQKLFEESADPFGEKLQR
ncbi:type II toxin-antitoxin system prevent-host-death family antitoxin [Sphingomonas koreensis]|nr:type II toxin-antitoxin system prevent-host-death family antitoxin [Sphingomonas koreensis]TPG40495.1 type II toxin-antitoxin system prevent-host-death family antitoxin [Sphingomonas koreensis]